MDDIQLRIRKFIDETRLTFSEFAKKIGTHQSSLSRALSDGNKVGDATLNKISIAFGINKQWLLTGEGDMVTNEQKSENNSGLGIIGNNVNGGSINDHKVVLEMVELLRKKDEQIDRLIGIIEKIK